MSSKKNISPRLAVLLIVVALALIAVIVLLKTNAGTATTEQERDSTANVAIPDTSLTPDVRDVVTPDSTTFVPSDTLTVEADTRPADEAGAEDGYWDGYHDGVAGAEQSRYDTSSSYKRQEQRDTYTANYEESYRRGFDEGSKAKQ